MGVAVASPVEVARIWQDINLVLVPSWIAEVMSALHFFCQHLKRNPFYAARGACKRLMNNIASKADGLKNLSPFVGLEGRYTHFGHDLEHPLAHGLFVVGHDVLARSNVGHLIKGTLCLMMPKGFKC